MSIPVSSMPGVHVREGDLETDVQGRLHEDHLYTQEVLEETKPVSVVVLGFLPLKLQGNKAHLHFCTWLAPQKQVSRRAGEGAVRAF